MIDLKTFFDIADFMQLDSYEAGRYLCFMKELYGQEEVPVDDLWLSIDWAVLFRHRIEHKRVCYSDRQRQALDRMEAKMSSCKHNNIKVKILGTNYEQRICEDCGCAWNIDSSD